jgi:hypothetical protein
VVELALPMHIRMDQLLQMAETVEVVAVAMKTQRHRLAEVQRKLQVDQELVMEMSVEMVRELKQDLVVVEVDLVELVQLRHRKPEEMVEMEQTYLHLG